MGNQKRGKTGKARSLKPKRLTGRSAKRIRGGGFASIDSSLSSNLITGVGLPASDAAAKDSTSVSLHITAPIWKKP
jgi:hypothetical protein